MMFRYYYTTVTKRTLKVDRNPKENYSFIYDLFDDYRTCEKHTKAFLELNNICIPEKDLI